MVRTRIIGVLLLALGAMGLAFAVPTMVRRVRAHNQDASFQRWAFQPIQDDEFEFSGEPIRIEVAPAAGVRASWRGETIELPSGGRTDPRLPGLVKAGDWMQVMEMRPLERVGTAPDAPLAPAHDADDSRLILVARRPAPGASDERFVNRKGWVYEIVRFRRPGEAPDEPLREPAPDKRGAPTLNAFTHTDAVSRWTINFAALPNYERTWQYAAALAVTPRLGYPRNKFTDDGLHAMAWTWPAAGVSTLSLVAGLTALASGRVSRERLRAAAMA